MIKWLFINTHIHMIPGGFHDVNHGVGYDG